MFDEYEILRSPRGGEGTDALTAILGNKAFNHPKPPTLIRNLLRQATRKNSLVVDFFAGSGTTAQAVLELNVEDGGGRRFILVSSTEATKEEPDKNVCRDVCAPRIKAVMNGYRDKDGTGGSFAYLQVRRIPNTRVFNTIQNDQVWCALQLIHGLPLADFDVGAAVQLAGDADERLAYVPRLSETVVAEVERLASLGGRLTVYAWQPGQLLQRIAAPNVALQRIPEFRLC